MERRGDKLLEREIVENAYKLLLSVFFFVQGQIFSYDESSSFPNLIKIHEFFVAVQFFCLFSFKLRLQFKDSISS